MRRTSRFETWTVYRMTLRGAEAPVSAVCVQSEWDALEAARPGYYTLVRAGIATEGEAERLARGTSGDPTPRAPRSAAKAPSPAPAGTAGPPGGGTASPR
jgi:hypothetical protein